MKVLKIEPRKKSPIFPETTHLHGNGYGIGKFKDSCVSVPGKNYVYLKEKTFYISELGE